MIVDERMTQYIHSLDSKERDYLMELEQYALRTDVPIIRKEMQSFLKTILCMVRPMRVLEVGTAIGFSALLMSEYLPKDANITTIEKYEKRIPIAKENFQKYGKDKDILLLEGDAAQWLAKLDGPYDFIFMDAAKAQYIHYLPDLVRLLSMNGVLLSDNVLQEGDIIESKYAVIKRNRTIHARMREYLYALKNHEQLMTSVLTIGDGVTLSVKTDCMNF